MLDANGRSGPVGWRKYMILLNTYASGGKLDPVRARKHCTKHGPFDVAFACNLILPLLLLKR
jgi:hypothetical protein